MKIVMACIKDQAGSGQQFVNALREHGHSASLVVQAKHASGYRSDLLLSGNKAERMAMLRPMMKGADILHFKGDHLPGTGGLKIFDAFDVARVFTAGGSGFRRRSDDLPKSVCLHWQPVHIYRKRVNAMSCISPDLMYDEDISLLPHAHQPMLYSWKNRSRPLIGHSPSNRGKKGTDIVLIPALDELRRRGYDFDVDLIEGVSNEECIRRKSQCTVFFDQAIVPAYGMSAVEAMMAGIPVVTRMDERSISRHPDYTNCPMSFFSSFDPLSAADAIAAVLDSNIEERSWRTFKWASFFHGYEEANTRLMALYSRAAVDRSDRIRRFATMASPSRLRSRSLSRQPLRQAERR